MATRYAVATGNWSSVATWDGGTTLPTASDDVFADGKTVTIDQNVTVLSLRTTARSGGTAGGGFTCSTARTIDLSAGTGVVAGASSCLTLSHTSGTTITLNGAIVGSATTNNCYGIVISGTGTTNITGNATGGTQTNGYCHAVQVTAAATINFTGSATGGSGGGNRGVGISLTTTAATLSVTGNVLGYSNNPGIGGSGAPTVTIVGNITSAMDTSSIATVDLTGAAVVTITGTVTGSTSGSGYAGVRMTNSAGTCSITGTLTASLGPALTGTGAYTLTGPFVSSASGIIPIQATGSVKLTGMTGNEFRFAKSTGGTFSLWSSDVNTGSPTAANVRKGTTFGKSSEYVGTMAIPAAANVVSGVPVDVSSVGTAAVSGQSWL